MNTVGFSDESAIMTPNEIRESMELEKNETKHYAHIVSPPENPHIFGWLMQHGNNDPSSRDIVAAARENRWAVKALCGYVFVPERNPDAYDACQICMDVAGMHMRNAGE